MSKMWGGRVWKNQEVLDNFSNNMGLLLEYQLALESYMLLNNIKNDDRIEKAIKALSDLRKRAKIINDEEEVVVCQESTNIIQHFNKLINEIGNEKFIFYDDGTIEYNEKGI